MRRKASCDAAGRNIRVVVEPTTMINKTFFLLNRKLIEDVICRGVRSTFTLATLATIVYIAILPSMTLAQASTKQANAKPVAGGTVTHQWEYLVVSFGKALFSDPIADPEIKTQGGSKLLAFSKAGIVTAQEAISNQRQMDALGRFGWELVGTVGEIGGDQELLFKRPFDAAQSKHEAALIAQEGALLAAEQKEEAARLVSQPTDELTDQDAVAGQQALDAYRGQEEKRLKDAIATVTGYTFAKVTATSTAPTLTDSNVLGNVTIDATSTLLHDGNKYSGDAAKKMAKDASDAIYQAAGLVPTSEFRSKEMDAELGAVRVIIRVVVNFHGQTQEVATEAVGGKWST